MKKLLLLFVVLLGMTARSQSDAKATQMLNRVSEKLSSYENIYAEFKYALHNKQAGIKQQTKGNVTIEGDKFHANYMGIDDIFDGQKRYQIIHENEEVNISKSEDENEFTPTKIFSFYKKGYRYKMGVKQNIKGRMIQYIRLIPKDSKSEESYILLGIDPKTYHIFNVIIIEKNGSKITLEINKFLTDQVLPAKIFSFSKDKYKDFYINELD